MSKSYYDLYRKYKQKYIELQNKINKGGAAAASEPVPVHMDLVPTTFNKFIKTYETPPFVGKYFRNTNKVETFNAPVLYNYLKKNPIKQNILSNILDSTSIDITDPKSWSDHDLKCKTNNGLIYCTWNTLHVESLLQLDSGINNGKFKHILHIKTNESSVVDVSEQKNTMCANIIINKILMSQFKFISLQECDPDIVNKVYNLINETDKSNYQIIYHPSNINGHDLDLAFNKRNSPDKYALTKYGNSIILLKDPGCTYDSYFNVYSDPSKNTHAIKFNYICETCTESNETTMYVSLHIQGSEIDYFYSDLVKCMNKFIVDHESYTIKKIILSGDFNNRTYGKLNYTYTLEEKNTKFNDDYGFIIDEQINSTDIDHILILTNDKGYGLSSINAEDISGAAKDIPGDVEDKFRV